ncbi:MAG TPA: F0F1 ATP synthase subunit A [Nocardioides sp.]|nr:F0F1 ATP synthase subunit A [Nocardioides sp.]
MTGLLPMSGESGIEIGEHVQREFLGMTFNMDTIWTTLIAGTIVLILGFWARSALTKDSDDHVPSKIQILWEAIVGEVNRQVLDNLGRVHPFVVPLAVALFFFILIANWLELIPSQLNETSGHLLPAPTADTNLTYALAAVTIVSVWIYGIRTKGAKGYFKHFLEPYPALLPLNILEELTKPITLALRLFGNIFAGGIMLALIGLIPAFAMWAPNLLWKLFDMFIGGIQAFIFALLTVLYFGMAGAGHDDHDEEHEESDDAQPTPGAVAEHEDDHQESPALAH